MDNNKQYNNNSTTAYIAGTFDGDSEIHIGISRKESYHLGYRISIILQIKRQWPFALSKIDEFCLENSINATLTEEKEKFVLRIRSPEHIQYFLKLIHPYILDKQEEVDHMIEEITPRLSDGSFYKDEEEFVELVDEIDTLREISKTNSWSKYTAEYFREEFGISENDESS